MVLKIKISRTLDPWCVDFPSESFSFRSVFLLGRWYMRRSDGIVAAAEMWDHDVLPCGRAKDVQ